jgi:hypothetical protein
MENVHLSVIPAPAYCLQGQAPAGIHWLQVLRDPCLRRDDGEEASFDTLQRGEGIATVLSPLSFALLPWTIGV